MKNWRVRSFNTLFLLVLFVPLLVSCSNPFSKENPGDAQFRSSGSKGSALTNTSATATATYNAMCDGKQTTNTAAAGITVTINKQCVTTSQFASGLTLSDGSLDIGNSSDPTAAANVQSMIKQGVNYVNTPIMGWGLPDPWPDPSTPGPTAWSALDGRVQMAKNLGATPMITLAIAPWWMKGTYVGHGKTQPLTADQEWQSVAYESRILDNKMDAWTHLVQAVAQRYMRPPYNVRYFQVWNELKGYYDPDINNYDFTTSAGEPGGANAKHGYTYMYNQVYTTLMNVASSLQIAQSTVKVGGPYVFVDTWSNAKQSDPSNVVKPYGIFDQRPLDVVQYWLQHKTGAGFITFDASLENRDTMKVLHQQPFVADSLFADTIKWIRSLDPTLYPGSTTLPINLSEWFSWTEMDNTSLQEDNALKTSTMVQFIQAGGATALSWNNTGNGGSDYGLWTSTLQAGGGQANPWYDSYKALMENFGVGTKLYQTNVSNPASVDALASNGTLLLVNKTADSVQVQVNGSTIPLGPYQVSFTTMK